MAQCIRDTLARAIPCSTHASGEGILYLPRNVSLRVSEWPSLKYLMPHLARTNKKRILRSSTRKACYQPKKSRKGAQAFGGGEKADELKDDNIAGDEVFKFQYRLAMPESASEHDYSEPVSLSSLRTAVDGNKESTRLTTVNIQPSS
jgi:hypothetical protein